MIVCYEKTKFLGNKLCKFEPRYDKSPINAPGLKLKNYTGEDLDIFLDSFRQITYVRDVCVKCGKTIERTK